MQAEQITECTKNITELEIRIISPPEAHAYLSSKCKFRNWRQEFPRTILGSKEKRTSEGGKWIQASVTVPGTLGRDSGLKEGRVNQ